MNPFLKRRKEVMVDVVPNASMPIYELVAIGLQNGVKFQDCKTPEEIVKTIDIKEIVKILHEQVEFIEWQAPVDEIKNRRSTVNPNDPTKDGTVHKFRVTYTGNMMYPVVVGDKSQVFLPGVPYEFGVQHAHIVERLKGKPNFKVEVIIAKEDPFVALMRQMKEQEESDDVDYSNLRGFYV